MILNNFRLIAVLGISASSAGTAFAGTIVTSAFNGVTSGAVLTTGALDWGYVSSGANNAFSMFDETRGGAGPYNNTGYNDLTSDEGNNLTTVSGSSQIGLVTLAENPNSVSNGVSGQNNTSNFTFDTNTAYGSYGGFAPGESDVWGITFNDLGVGTFNITLYLGHSQTNRSFDFDVTLTDAGGGDSTTTTTGGTIAGLGSTVAAYSASGAAFTYDITVTTTDPGADLTLVHGDTGGGSFGGAIFAGYTVNGTIVPEPSSLALLGLGSLGLAFRRRR